MSVVSKVKARARLALAGVFAAPLLVMPDRPGHQRCSRVGQVSISSE
jgi:hypothetical protein